MTEFEIFICRLSIDNDFGLALVVPAVCFLSVMCFKWGMEMHGTLIYASLHKHSEVGLEPGRVPFRQSLLSADGPLMAPQLATKDIPLQLAALPLTGSEETQMRSLRDVFSSKERPTGFGGRAETGRFWFVGPPTHTHTESKSVLYCRLMQKHLYPPKEANTEATLQRRAPTQISCTPICSRLCPPFRSFHLPPPHTHTHSPHPTGFVDIYVRQIRY